MALPIPENPRINNIELNSRQYKMYTKYKLENVRAIEQQFIDLRNVEVSDINRDLLLSKAELEVEALVEFAREGGFSRDFVYFNNNLNKAYESMRAAYNDTSLLTIPWADMIIEIINGNYSQYMELVNLHQNELNHLAQHIRNIVNGIQSMIKDIIRIASNIIKEMFETIIVYVQNYKLPSVLIAVPIGVLFYTLYQNYICKSKSSFALSLTAYLNPVAACAITAIGTASVTYGIIKFIDTNNRLQRENIEVQSLGLPNSRDTIQSLMRAIEDKKFTVLERRAYNNTETKLCEFRRQIEDLIRARVKLI